MKGAFAKSLKRITILSLSISMMYVFILMYPSLLFSYHKEYRNYDIYSDQPIHSNVSQVLDNALDRLAEFERFTTESRFTVFLCQSDWRFTLLTRNPNAGGIVNFVLSPNIFIRPCNLPKNRLIPPSKWKNSMEDRPLSYFIAHESVHVLQRQIDRWMVLHTPPEIIEGFAEYIAKGSGLMDQYLDDYLNQRPNMNPDNGLYDLYYLYMATLIEKVGYDFDGVLREKPGLGATLAIYDVEQKN